MMPSPLPVYRFAVLCYQPQREQLASHEVAVVLKHHLIARLHLYAAVNDDKPVRCFDTERIRRWRLEALFCR